MAQFSLIFMLALYCATTFIKHGNSAITTNTENIHKSQDVDPKYPPFMVLLDRKKLSTSVPDDFIIPSRYVNTDKGLSLQSADEETDLEEIPLCPEHRPKNTTLLQYSLLLRDNSLESNGCLFVVESQENEKQTCNREPRPQLVVPLEETGSEFICGANDKQKLITAEYYNCGTKEYFTKYREKASAAKQSDQEESHFHISIYVMYEICFDFKNKKTLWTRHQVLGPKLLTYKDYPHKDLNTVSLTDFNTETFDLGLDPGTFIEMKKSYEPIPNNKTDPLHPNMKIYPLVPKDHMALPYWKKSTDHMINSAPLLPQFLPIVKAIHNGILLASNYYLRKFHQTVTVFTKAEMIHSIKHNFSSALNLKSTMASLMPDFSIDVFRPSMWYIAVFNEKDQSGILIVLHNTKEALPAKKECDEKEMLACDIKSWAEDPDLIIADDLKNAYCCQIMPERFQKLFSINKLKIDISIQKNLEIPEVIRSEKEYLSKTVTDEQRNVPKL